jgi:hypothetical protein
MKIKKVSMITDIEREMELDITEEQLKRWQDGALIQNVFSNLTADAREFLMTGVVPEEWDAVISDN